LAVRVPSDLPPAQLWQSSTLPGPSAVIQPPLFSVPAAEDERSLHSDRVRLVRLSGAAAPGLPDVVSIAARLGVGMAEVLAGQRTAAHLALHVSAAVLERLDALAAPVRLGGPARVRVHSLRVQLITARTAEACLHVSAGPRIVLAYRLVGRRTRWVCTAVEPLLPGSGMTS